MENNFSYDKCFELWEMYEMLPNIREHSITVARISFFLANRLKNKGCDLSIWKATAGALLHDIAKTRCITTGEDHCKIGREICERHGLFELAEIVEEHVRLKDGYLNGILTEKHIVCYADKRVKHNSIVTLRERLEDILTRYAKGVPETRNRILKNFEVSKLLEKEIFDRLGLGPELLERALLDEMSNIPPWRPFP